MILNISLSGQCCEVNFASDERKNVGDPITGMSALSITQHPV